MSDLGFTSSLPAITSESGIDSSGIDQNLRRIKAVEAGWRLPALPDMVRLDLASMPGVDNQVGDLLRGIDMDLAGEDDNSIAPIKPDYAVVMEGVEHVTTKLREVAAFDPAIAVDLVQLRARMLRRPIDHRRDERGLHPLEMFKVCLGKEGG